MFARHVWWHAGIAAAAVVVLPLFGVAWPTALFIGLMAGCVAMAAVIGHGDRQQRVADRPVSKQARIDASEE